MEENNNKISAFQFAVLGFFIFNSPFVGSGIINMFIVAKQDAWLANLMSLILGMIPILILIYIMNYKPDINILEKNKVLFGKIIGNIINFIICAYIFFTLILILKSGIGFAVTMYLTKTPNIVVASVIILVTIYAVIKGIETIGRTGETLFFMAIILVGIIVFSLVTQFHFDDLKPILADGFKPMIKDTLLYLSYTTMPIIILGIIPKNNIVNNKKYHRYLIGGFAMAILLMQFVFLLIPGVITPALASLYRYPAYYVLRKINIGGVINNMENITSIHWFFNTFIMIMMCIYFLSVYIKDTFKIKQKKSNYIVISIIGFMAIIGSQIIFQNPASMLEFTRGLFPLGVSLELFIILLVTFIVIFIKRRKEKKPLKQSDPLIILLR